MDRLPAATAPLRRRDAAETGALRRVSGEPPEPHCPMRRRRARDVRSRRARAVSLAAHGARCGRKKVWDMRPAGPSAGWSRSAEVLDLVARRDELAVELLELGPRLLDRLGGL